MLLLAEFRTVFRYDYYYPNDRLPDVNRSENWVCNNNGCRIYKRGLSLHKKESLIRSKDVKDSSIKIPLYIPLYILTKR